MRSFIRAVGSARSARSVASASGMLEHLEQRTMLTVGQGGFDPGTGIVNWKGFALEAHLDSWVLTFRGELGKAQALQRAYQVAGFLGVNPIKIEASPLGRFARISASAGRITDADGDAALARFPGVLQGVQPDLVYRKQLVPNDPGFGGQWALQNTGLPFSDRGGTAPVNGLVNADISAVQGWDVTTGSERVLIGIIDSGIDLTHPDLRDNIWRNPGEIAGNSIDDDGNGFVDDVNGWDFQSSDASGQDNTPQDNIGQGHGTLVAGTIGATGNNGIGITGINWKVGLISVKVAPDGASSGYSTFAIIQGNEYFTTLRRQGYNVVATNNSYGAIAPATFDEFNSAEEVSIQTFTDTGGLFIASAGNDSLDNDSSLRAYPASYPNPNIIAVAATNNRDGLSGFSNFGRTTVDVGAPGSDVTTTTVGGGYQRVFGTSFAGPYTAGVIGLLSAANPFATPAQLRQALLGGVDVVPGLQGRVLTNGRINAAKSLALVAARGPLVTAISPGRLSGPVNEIQVQFNRPIDPSLLDASQILLRRAAGDGLFNGNDVVIALTGGNLSLSGTVLTITLPGGVQTPRDRYRLVLPNASLRDLAGNRLNGSSTEGTDETYEFEIVVPRGPYELNDTINTASPLILSPAGRASLSDLVIGDGEFNSLDVDIFRVFAGGPSLISASIIARALPNSSTLDSYLRLFDSAGNEIAFNDNFEGLDSKLEFFVPNAGQYYIAVSAFPNRQYAPALGGSGVASPTGGNYSLEVQVATSTSAAVQYVASGLPLPIPAQGSITSTITIIDQRSIASLLVRLDLVHPFVSDLIVTLTSPGGQIIQLFNRRGGTGDNLSGTVFDDTATVPISAGAAPFTGSFRPEAGLISLADTIAAGVWTLTVTDTKAGDAGTLVGWGLDVVLRNNASGPYELNDTLGLASDLQLRAGVSRTVRSFLGDGAFGLRDTDLFVINADSGSTLQVTAIPIAGSFLDAIVRVFDAEGNEIKVDKRKGATVGTLSLSFVAAGRFFVGISGGNTTSNVFFGNDSYDPRRGGSGADSDATGAYDLTLSLTPGVSEAALALAGNRISAALATDGTLGNLGTGVGLRLGSLDFLASSAGLSSYFGASFNGLLLRNAGPGVQSDLALRLSNESDFANRRALTQGSNRSLNIQRSISFGTDDRFLVIDITLRNTSTLSLTGVGWVEGFKPAQGRNLGSPDDRTFVNVLNTGGLATSRFAGGAFPGGATIGLGAVPGSVPFAVSFEESDTVRDPAQVYGSPSDPDPTGENGTYVGGLDAAIGFNVGTLAGNASVSFRYFIFVGETTAAVTTQYALLTGGTGAGHLVANPLTPGLASATLPYTVYYPEGFANNRSSTFLPLVNGNNLPARVVIIAHYEGSAAPDVLYDSATDATATDNLLPGLRREGITITRPDLYASGTTDRIRSEIVGRLGVRKNTPFSLEVRSTLPVGALLSHYDFGISTGQAFVSTLADTWTFGEARKSDGINDFVVFYNPNPTPLKVTLTLARAQGQFGAPYEFSATVEGFRRGGWNLSSFTNQQLPAGSYGVRVDADARFVAALTSFDSNRDAGFTTIGLPSLGSLVGGTSEGQIGSGASGESLAIFNPGSAPASVTVNFAFQNGSSLRRTIGVDPVRRTTIDVATIPNFPLGLSYAVTYTSTQPVVLSLISFGPETSSGSILTQNASSQWLFGEGFRPVSPAGYTSEYLRLFNPTATDLPVEISILFNNGESETFLRILSGRNVGNFNLDDFITGTRRTIGTTPGVGSFYGIKVVSPVPILAFYGHFDRFFSGGFGTLGTPLGSTSAPTV